MIHGMIDLTIKDCQNILLWYELYFKNKNTPTQGDINTHIKIKALAISDKDEYGKFDRILRGEGKGDSV